MWLRRLLLASLLAGSAARAAVPPDYQDLYALLSGRLDAFDRTLASTWDGSRYPVTFATELLGANGNRGRQLLQASALAGTRLELDRLHALGVTAVTIAIPFPILDPAFLAWNGDPADREPLIAFFTQLRDDVHARGMKLFVETGAMFPGVYSAGSGMDAAGYFTTLSDADYVAGRTAMVETIVTRIRPDLLNVGSEPDTESRLTGRSFPGNPVAFAAMIRGFVERAAAVGAGDVPLLAGTGTWLANASTYVGELVKIPGLWGIDLHLYPVNRGFLDAALPLAAQARAAGKRVTMLECWLQKERDSELGVIDSAFDPGIFARDALDFWGPLDRRFLASVVAYANAAKLEALSPFWSRYFLAYLDAGALAAQVPPPTAAQIVGLATAAHARAIGSGETTSTGRTYAELVADPSGVPSVGKLVPIVLDAAGAGGSRYTTELSLANRGDVEVGVALDYVPAPALGASGAGSVSTTLPASRQLVVGDVVAFLRERGVPIPKEGSQGGTLRVTFTGGSDADAFAAVARTTTPSGTGRAGLAYAGLSGVDARTGTSIVPGLRATARDRTNLALANAGERPVTLRVTLVSGAGDLVTRTLPDVTLAPGEWTQLGRVLDGTGLASAFARIDVVSGAGPYVAYAAVNDEVSNDGSYVPSVPALSPPEPVVVPALVESATYATELLLLNPTKDAVTATLRYVESLHPEEGGGGAVTVVTVPLAPLQQLLLPDALEALRARGLRLGAKGTATFAGALTVSFATSSGASVCVAGTRVASTGAASYGVFAPAVGWSRLATEESWVFGLRQDGTVRSNVALVNAGDAGDAITLRVDLTDGASGRRAGSLGPFTLGSGAWLQVDAALSSLGLSNAFARVVRLEGKSRWLAYGVVNDGTTPSSGGTNDGSYVAMADH